MKYSLMADAYEKIEGTTKRLEITDYPVEFLKKTSSDRAVGKVSNDSTLWQADRQVINARNMFRFSVKLLYTCPIHE